MDLRDDIKKATRIPRTSEKAHFVRLREPDRATLDRNMNKRNFKKPRNINLVEEDNSNKSDNKDSVVFNASEIYSAIKAATGGVSYSNKALEDRWRSKQMNRNLNESLDTSNSSKKLSSTFSNVAKLSSVQDANADESQQNEEHNNECENNIVKILEQCKLSKNAVVVGLLKNNQITVKDLKMPETPTVPHKEIPDQSDTQTKDVAIGSHLIQHPDEPDIYIHSLQFAEQFNKSKGNKTDFVFDHVGVKTVVTPQQYYIDESDDASFKFIKINTKDK